MPDEVSVFLPTPEPGVDRLGYLVGITPMSTPNRLPPEQWPHPLTPWKRTPHYADAQSVDALVRENSFIGRMPDRAYPPNFPESRAFLPEPFWDGHPDEIAGYWEAWNLAFRNCKRAPLRTGFIAPFIDTAFDDTLVMWDSVFILMFARYGERAFPFHRTLDNFYAKQHPSGHISRQISENTGEDAFHYADADGSGPNVMPWAEWEYYLQFRDRERLAEVFPPLLSYYRWTRKNRSWPDGTYWSTGWGCGMDNQPRLSAALYREKNDRKGWLTAHEHDHMSWLDTTAQAVFSATLLCRMARELGRETETADLAAESAELTAFVNAKMWNEDEGFYVDRRRDGSISDVKSVGAFWTLIAGIATTERAGAMIAHLSNPATFGRPHPVPSLSADHPDYAGEIGGLYWRGGVWPSANYMVLRSLTLRGEDALAHSLARKHVDFVTKVYKDTGTFWEDYSPEKPEPGKPALRDLVGWGGLGPIAVLLEYVIGLRPDFERDVVRWDVRLTEAHGVRNYPVGPDLTLDLAAAARADANAEPVVTVKANRPVRLEIHWPGGVRTMEANP